MDILAKSMYLRNIGWDDITDALIVDEDSHP